jgi:hypothetical protein
MISKNKSKIREEVAEIVNEKSMIIIGFTLIQY